MTSQILNTTKLGRLLIKNFSASDEIGSSFPQEIDIRIERSAESFENHDSQNDGRKVRIQFDVITETMNIRLIMIVKV
jgi:hypothetical protein